MSISGAKPDSVDQTLNSLKGPLYNLTPLFDSHGAFPHWGNLHQVCRQGLTPEEFETQSEQISGFYRSEEIRSQLIGYAQKQLDNRKGLAKLQRTHFEVKEAYEGVEQSRQSWMAAQYKTAAATVDTATARVEGQRSFERFSGAQLSLQRDQALNQIATAQASVDVGAKKLALDAASAELDAKLAGLRVRLDEAVMEKPGATFDLPASDYASVDLPKVDLLSDAGLAAVV